MSRRTRAGTATVGVMRAFGILLVSVLVAAPAGCGGGDDEDRLSRAALSERVNAVCRELRGAADAAPPPGRDDIRAYFERTLPPRRALVDDLPAPSRAPEAIAKDYERFVQARRAELDALEDVGRTVGDLVAAAEAAAAVDRARKMAGDLGAALRFADCR